MCSVFRHFVSARGYFVAPTVLDGVEPHHEVFREEVFGPVITLTPFRTLEEAIELANDTPYGLGAWGLRPLLNR